MKQFLLPSICAFMLLTGCTGNPPSDTDTTTQPYQTPATNPVIPVAADSAGKTQNTTVTTTQPQPATAVTQPSPSKSTGALNPAHGQPGHRCDIEVGAPLNSALKQTTQAAPTTSKPAATTNGSVKLNPAHGQPGHDCSVAVGQPLKG